MIQCLIYGIHDGYYDKSTAVGQWCFLPWTIEFHFLKLILIILRPNPFTILAIKKFVEKWFDKIDLLVPSILVGHWFYLCGPAVIQSFDWLDMWLCVLAFRQVCHFLWYSTSWKIVSYYVELFIRIYSLIRFVTLKASSHVISYRWTS